MQPKPAPAPLPAQTGAAPVNGARPPPDASKMRSSRPERLDRPSDRTRTSRERPSGRPAESKSKDPFDIFADPPKSSSRRPRRNSESSVMDRSSKLLDDDDDDKRRRERRREREARHRDGKPRSSRKDRRLDIIDKLDVTSIYGTGSEFAASLHGLLYTDS
jgi:hypothetical protein